MKERKRHAMDLVLLTILGFGGGLCREQELLVAEGSVAVLPCVDVFAEHTHPTAVHWSRRIGDSFKTVWRRNKNGLEFRPIKDPLSARCPLDNFGKFIYNLHIEAISLADGGEYECQVEGKISKMVKVIMLRVVRASISPDVVVEGSRMEVNCQISPRPKNFTLKWKKDKEFVNKNGIDSISQRDAGNWGCVVSYKNQEVEATASLQVRGISTPQDDSSVFYAAVGSSISLPCIFTDGLIPNTTIWKKIGSHVPLPESFKSSSGFIHRVEDGDEGTYRCSGVVNGMNGMQTVQRSMKLVVAQVSSSSRGITAVTLFCYISSPGLITAYEWLRETRGPNDTRTLSIIQKSSSSRIQISERDIGEWICRFYDHEGLLGNASYHLDMMSALKGGKSSSGNKAALVMGLGFLFLLVFLILLQMYRIHRRRKMIHQYPAMESIIHQVATEREHRERSREKTAKACAAENQFECV
ncbi:hypothetical protein DNTS_030369 [Danionella cerebrum]|uniref:Ig-like domain-containing protein n=1 Tax=Danionella cerebrum TaxID=2873325 RepID=A0A553QWC7_9TELE|nr:hypothetical protein DNTS_030369 [Danionella translucida]